MTRPLFTFSLLASTALTSPAWAEITPAEAWQDLRTMLEGYGYTVSGAESGSGDTLTVSDVVLTTAVAEEDGEFRIDLGTVTLSDAGDEVAVTLPDVMPIRYDFEVEPGVRATGVVDYTHTGLDMRVSGSASAPVWDYTADTLTLTLAELIIDGTTVPDDASRMSAVFSDVAGQMASDIGATRTSEQSFTAESVNYELFFSDTESPDSVFQVIGQITQMALTGDSETPLTAQDAAGFNPFSMGLTSDFSLSHQGSEISLNATDDGTVSAFESTSQSGGINTEVTETGLSYDLTSQEITLQFATPDIPFPIALEAEEAAFAVAGPMQPSDSPQPFNVGLTFAGFEMPDFLWNVFDPGSVLPRDPATLDMKLSGEMRQLVDLFDEEAVMAMGETDLPAELHALQIDALTLDVAGLLLDGTGGVTFDNDDLETYAGFPAPNGEVTFTLTGANALIDNLISMGLLPQEQAMGARMMMSMFARPVGDDVLSTTLEFGDNGEIRANGQRLQ